MAGFCKRCYIKSSGLLPMMSQRGLLLQFHVNMNCFK